MSSDRCKTCGNLDGHLTDLEAAACVYRAASTRDLQRIASEFGADTVAAADLVAHLRGPLSDPAAYMTARYVLELGWRPVVGFSTDAA